jgi:hypothetical protein
MHLCNKSYDFFESELIGDYDVAGGNSTYFKKELSQWDLARILLMIKTM